jgi:hypothetical protein
MPTNARLYIITRYSFKNNAFGKDYKSAVLASTWQMSKSGEFVFCDKTQGGEK